MTDMNLTRVEMALMFREHLELLRNIPAGEMKKEKYILMEKLMALKMMGILEPMEDLK